MKLIHYKVLTLVLLVLLVGSAVFWIQNVGFKSLKKISADEAGKKAIAYINDKILGNQSVASLNNINEDKEKGLYRLELNVNNQVYVSYMTLDGNILFPDAVDLGQQSNTSAATAAVPPAGETVDGEFVKLANKEVCKENGKPIVYFFGSEGCTHCRWEKPILEKVVAQFGDKISYHENIDTAKDQDIFSQYSTGSVPTIVLGCQYYRIGSGENSGETEETKVLTKLIQELL